VPPAGFADCRVIPDRMVTAAAQAYRQCYATGVVTKDMAGRYPTGTSAWTMSTLDRAALPVGR
jgi:hypothetical protein